jgi:nucleoside-diphosphate-sugar epimerase
LKKALITGINSFLAKELCKLLQKDFSVYGLVNSNKENIPSFVNLVSAEQLNKLEDEFVFVFHLAAHVPSKGKLENNLLFDTNVKLTETLLNKFKKARFVFASSVSVYGDGNRVIDENSASINAGEYGLSKLWAEQLIKKHSSYAILRISSMYGAGMKKSTFLPLIIDNALTKGEISILGNGARKQDYVHVSDVAKTLFLAANCETNFTGLAVSGKSYTNLEMAELVKQNCQNIEIKSVGEDFGQSYEYDKTQTSKVLGNEENVYINQGLKELIEWIKK